MLVRDIAAYLRSLDGGWVDWNTSVDRVVVGDSGAEVTGIAVGWMAYLEALQHARALGCNLFVTHEPTFFDHRDQSGPIERFAGVREKREWVSQSGMVVLRCHDVWDRFPGRGIPDSWGAFLGLGEAVRAEDFLRLYRIEPISACEFASSVAQRTASLGQTVVEMVGPADRVVQTVALGTGAISPLPQMLDLYSPDVAVCSDDGFTYWHAGALAIDLGVPVVVVNHAVCELPGIRSLADTLAARFPEVPVHYLEQSSMFLAVGDPGGIRPAG